MTRILVVEDHPTMRRSLRSILSADGYEVDEVADGAAALAALGTGPPDAIVLDLHVPVIDGAEVLRRIRAEPATRTIPVIVVSATGEEERRPLMAMGADAYLTKPFDPPVLLDRIERALRAAGWPAG